MARSSPLSCGIRSAPTTETFTRCRVPARDAAWTRVWALSPSPFCAPAQCTITSAPATAASIPAPVSRSPRTNSTSPSSSRACRLSTRTLAPASRSRGTTSFPSVPVPPVTKIRDVMVPPVTFALGRSVVRYDGPRRENVTDGRRRPAGPAVRGEQAAAAGDGLPDARLAQRRRGRGAGRLDARVRGRGRGRGQPRGLVYHHRGPGVPGHAALAQVQAGGPAGPGRGGGRRRDRGGTRVRGAAGRLGRARAAGGAGHAAARRTGGVRAARHVRPALRRDRRDHRAVPGRCPPAGQPGPAADPRGQRARRGGRRPAGPPSPRGRGA